MLKKEPKTDNEKKRLRAVREHLAGETLRLVAARHGVHLVTLARWVKRYRTGGTRSLLDPDRSRSWNRPAQEVEERVRMLKEADPGLTVRTACAVLRSRGIRISASGVYAVWKRYNLVSRSVTRPTSPYGPETRSLRRAVNEAAVLLKRGRPADRIRAGRLINGLPYYPEGREALLEKMSDRVLTARRRFDRLYAQYLKIPMPEFHRRIRSVRQRLERENMNYSALLAGIMELQALHWMRHPRAELPLYRRLVRRKRGLRDPVMNFTLTLQATTALFELGRTREAQLYNRKTRQLLRSLPYSSFYESYGDILTFMGDYQGSLAYYDRALRKKPAPQSRVSLTKKIALSLVISGQYAPAARCLARMDIKPGQEYYEEYLSCRAFLSYGLGRFEEALRYVRETLDRAERHQFRNTMYSAIIVRAAVAQALGRSDEARDILGRYIRLLNKYHMKREVTILEFLRSAARPSPALRRMPVLRLLYLIALAGRTGRIAAYRRSLAYARQNGLTGFFHRAIVFSPAIVRDLLKKGRLTGLPATILRFPVFNRDVPSYTLKFLGRPVVIRDLQYVKARFRPKEEALLIHLALRAGEPGRSVPVQDLRRNFWPQSRDAASRLSHLLVAVKQKLGLPGHLMAMSSHLGLKCLVNRGFYMTTDYQDFETTLTEAQALERAGEWTFARDKYRQAFRLLRDGPFARIYDPWSEDLRNHILSRYEQEVKRFVRSCWSRRNRQDARRAAEQLRRIIRPPA